MHKLIIYFIIGIAWGIFAVIRNTQVNSGAKWYFHVLAFILNCLFWFYCIPSAIHGEIQGKYK